jgi:hypothetical protein
MINVNEDAFSSSQIGSKIWLCEELERLGWESHYTYIYAGWYGVTAFLLLSRGNFKVNNVRSIDIDPECEAVADALNNLWVWQRWRFKAITDDCNFIQAPVAPDLIINTSTEHFQSKDWFDNIPAGTRVVLQGNNMPHDDHFNESESAEEFASEFNLTTVDFLGTKEFVYPDWSFNRYMLIGTK